MCILRTLSPDQYQCNGHQQVHKQPVTVGIQCHLRASASACWSSGSAHVNRGLQCVLGCWMTLMRQINLITCSSHANVKSNALALMNAASKSICSSCLGTTDALADVVVLSQTRRIVHSCSQCIKALARRDITKSNDCCTCVFWL